MDTNKPVEKAPVSHNALIETVCHHGKSIGRCRQCDDEIQREQHQYRDDERRY